MADAYKVLQDTSLPKALALISEDEIKGKLYETEGRNYAAGDAVLAEDITPPLREAINNGSHEGILEPISLDEYEQLKAEAAPLFVPEHEVEHLALVNAGKKVVDREGKIALRSEGADDARSAQEAAKEDGADERPNLSFEEAAVPGDPDRVGGARVKDADDAYVEADTAAELEVQTLPSGVMATNPYVEKAKGGRKAAKPEGEGNRRPQRRQRPQEQAQGDEEKAE